MRSAITSALVVCLVATMGCGSADPAPAEGAGYVSAKLSVFYPVRLLADRQDFPVIKYQLTNSITGFHVSGATSSTQAGEIAAILVGIPVGPSYTLSLSATSKDGVWNCAGKTTRSFKEICSDNDQDDELRIQLICQNKWVRSWHRAPVIAEMNVECSKDAGVSEGGDAADAADATKEACVPLRACPSGDDCGTLPDGCGGTLSCGSCIPGLTCGGGNPGSPNTCGCVRRTTCIGGQTCGVQPDGCGGAIVCGTCPTGSNCNPSGICTCSVSACPACQTAPQACGAHDCGAAPDGCGNPVSCGTCSPGLTCTLAAGSASGNCGPQEVLTGMTGLSLGGGFACAVGPGGGVQCWGFNGNGALGNGTTTDSPLPKQVPGLTSGVTAVSAGNSSACAITAGGGVQCWGYNAFGQLGNNSTIGSSVPVQVSGLTSGVTAVSVGPFSACAITAGGALQCWGYNGTGLLGNNSTISSLVPVPVPGLASGVTAVSVGAQTACAITASGAVQCWGDNSYGGLGNNSTISSLVPVQVSGLSTGVTAVSVGASTCAIVSGGGVVCWGGGNALGNSPSSNCGGVPCNQVPVAVSGLTSGASSVSVGAVSACAVIAGGGVQCWGGDGGYGVLGTNATVGNFSFVPVKVTGLAAGASAVSVLGDPSACALTAGGGIECWGDNRYGELGNNSTINSAVPVAVECGNGGSCVVCVPHTQAQACWSGSCGTAPDGCGGTVTCGSCPAGQTCTSQSTCCQPVTTCPAGQSCGTIDDGCGGTIFCGSCPAGQTCTSQSTCCQPVTTCPAGQTCGTIDDGCGGTISCGSCPAGELCSASGQCGSCHPATTCPAGENCGVAPDGCGGTIPCGSCPAGAACSPSGQCSGPACAMFNNGAGCTPTEQKFIDKSVDCYTCLVNAACLDDVLFADANKECEDLMGNASGGAKARTSNESLCLSEIDCVLATSCASADVSACYCGSLMGNACTTSTTPGDGACAQAEADGSNHFLGEPASVVSPSLANRNLAAGKADAIFACSIGNGCDALCNL